MGISGFFYEQPEVMRVLFHRNSQAALQEPAQTLKHSSHVEMGENYNKGVA